MPLVVGGPGVTGRARSVAAADLDGDGDIDLVSANAVTSPGGSNNLTVLFQTDPGEFEAVARLAPEALFDPSSVLLADLDADGFPDIVGTSNGDPTREEIPARVAVFLQERRPGSRFRREELEVSGQNPSPFFVAAGDLDGDGDHDLVSANKGTDSLTLFVQAAPGSFLPSSQLLRTGDGPVGLALADLDGDGDLDIASANQDADNLSVFLQRPGGQFGPDSDFALGDAVMTPCPRCVTAADVNRDGRTDLVSANSGNGGSLTVFLARSDGPGFHLDPLRVQGGFARPFSVVAADLDRDGNVDLASANQGTDDLTLFYQQEDGTFPKRRRLDLCGGLNPCVIVAADVDRNGELDLLSANDRDLAVFLQGEDGVFRKSQRIAGVGNQFLSLALGDLDGDGDLDLAAASEPGGSGTGRLLLFLQTRPGFFDPSGLQFDHTASNLRSPRSVSLVDLDGDGDTDVISANFLSSDLTILFQ
jgi:hypothetical protein